jgi:hypothetical protein
MTLRQPSTPHRVSPAVLLHALLNHSPTPLARRAAAQASPPLAASPPTPHRTTLNASTSTLAPLRQPSTPHRVSPTVLLHTLLNHSPTPLARRATAQASPPLAASPPTPRCTTLNASTSTLAPLRYPQHPAT